MRRHLSARVAKAIGLATAGVAVVAGLKTAVEIVAGRSVEIQQVAFYLGSAAVALYVGFVAAIGVVALTLGIAAVVTPERVLDRLITKRVIDVIGLSLWAAGVVGVLVDGRVFDYDGASDTVRAGLAVVGVAAVAAGIWIYRLPDLEAGADAPAAPDATREPA